MMGAVEADFQSVAQMVALLIEGAAVVVVALGAAEAAFLALRDIVQKRETRADQRETWLRFATWILLALEFTLGADVIRTAVAPSWEDIGKLGAIAAIRTALGFFLARDLQEAAKVPATSRAKSDK